MVYPQFYGVGGIARYLDSFLTNLPQEHPTIYIITGDEHQMPRAYPNVEIIHIPFKANRLNLLFWMIQANRILKTLWKAQKISVVNLHIPPLITGLLLTRAIPMVLTAHTTYLGMSGNFYSQPYFKSQWSTLEIAIKQWLERIIFRHSKAIITLTTQGAEELKQYQVSAPVHIVPNGVDTQTFQNAVQVEKTVDVLFCGRIEIRKGSRAMVEVCQQLVARNPNIRILIVGYGDDDPWVKAQLQGYAHNITLAGKVKFTEMPNLYAKSKVYASTSYYEGLPGTCLEAMASGLPAVVWDFQFYASLVIQHQTGIRVVPNDIQAMVEAISQQLARLNDNKMISYQVTQHVNQYFNWQSLAKQLIQILH
ncbi:MAG: group 1 glycosyl transferase [Methylophilaceae bacterium 17-43-7]|nr:MAG: group 1 glycosyl transferase [Methylophilaceae bacterium 17-43-7]